MTRQPGPGRDDPITIAGVTVEIGKIDGEGVQWFVFVGNDQDPHIGFVITPEVATLLAGQIMHAAAGAAVNTYNELYPDGE